MPEEPQRALDPEHGRLALFDLLRQTEIRATSARVASMIGHLIGTPLNVIAGRAALIRSNPTAEYSAENARRIEEQVERLAQRVRRLIEYLTAPEPSGDARTAAQVARDAVALYGPIAAQRGLTLVPPAGLPPPSSVDGTTALVVLTSLISLALRGAEPGARLALDVVSREPGSVTFELTVPGMAPPRASIDRLEPPEEESRADSDRLQTLSVCSAIARRTGGRVEVVPHPQAGAVMRFVCPTA